MDLCFSFLHTETLNYYPLTESDVIDPRSSAAMPAAVGVRARGAEEAAAPDSGKS